MHFDGSGADHNSAHHTTTINHNHHGGLTSATTHLPTGGVLHQNIGGASDVHMTDGHGHEVWSMSGNHLDGQHHVEHANHPTSNVVEIQKSHDPLSHSQDTKLPPFKI